MMIDALIICGFGLLVFLLPLAGRYSTFLGRRVARLAGAFVPVEQQPALRARASRRSRAMGAGIFAAGVFWLLLGLLWPEWREQSSGVSVVLSLLVVCSAAALALVEILRPGDIPDGARFARTTAPVLSDYVAPESRVLNGALVGIGLAVLAGTFLLTQSPWFDAATIWRSPVLFLLAAVPLLLLLSHLATRRVLEVPQPARDQRELYWQDALRADTLSTLAVQPALVSLLALVVSGTTLDAAASEAATASGQLGPAWTSSLLIAGYVLPLALVGGAFAVAAARGDRYQFRRRLWPDGAPMSTGTEAD